MCGAEGLRVGSEPQRLTPGGWCWQEGLCAAWSCPFVPHRRARRWLCCPMAAPPRRRPRTCSAPCPRLWRCRAPALRLQRLGAARRRLNEKCEEKTLSKSNNFLLRAHKSMVLCPSKVVATLCCKSQHMPVWKCRATSAG